MRPAFRAACLVAFSGAMVAAAHAREPVVFDQGADFGSRIIFHAGRPAPNDAFDAALDAPLVLESGELAEALRALERHPSIEHLEIAGHVDGQECSGVECDALALRRASLVRDWLVAGGVAQHRLSVVGYGASRPVDTPGSRRSRRVELDVVQSTSAAASHSTQERPAAR